MNMTPPSNISTEGMSPQDAFSNYRVLCLHDAKMRHPDSHVIIVKDSSVSNASPDHIADVVSGAISSGDWHLCYLGEMVRSM